MEKRTQHATKETEYLRLKRSRLGVEDFEPIKVIGKGAFGEVRTKPDCKMPPFFFLSMYLMWHVSFIAGSTCTETGYGAHFRHESFEESRHGGARAGMTREDPGSNFVSYFKLDLDLDFQYLHSFYFLFKILFFLKWFYAGRTCASGTGCSG